ncbi:MAG TPA: hypothetical protein VIW24_24445 [Aldersonia sp.]
MNDLIVEVDSRNRVSLSKLAHKHNRYIVREEEDGTVILEPAVVLTQAERNYLASPDLQQAVEYSREHPEQLRPRPRRSSADR